MAGEPITVGEFVTVVRQTLVNDPYLANAAIIGEMTKVHFAGSGHCYFTLTDSKGSIDCVQFNGNSSFKQQNIEVGMKLVAIGGIDVYAKAGRMQFKASRVQPVRSIGEMERIRQELIQKWRDDGTMDRPRLPIPEIPKRLHIITGAGSAALADMERLIEDRWPGFNRTVIPVLVQGDNAPKEIVKAIQMASKHADLIIVGRGGGSPEDLWSFNLESVCQAIIDSPVPVVSAVGHESDFLVSDMICDLRASTPSNAVERVVPIKLELLQEIEQGGDRLELAVSRLFERMDKRLDTLSIRLSAAPMRGISNARLNLTTMKNRLNSSTDSILNSQRNRLATIFSMLTATNPVRVLERGYSMALNQEGKPVTSIEGLKSGDGLTVVLKDGQVDTEVK